MKKLTLLFLFTCCVTNGISQENTMSLSLNEAMAYALENNYNAINAKRDIEAAKKQKWETTATGLPQITANIDYQNYLKQPISLIPAEFFGGQPGEFAEVAFGTKQNINATAKISQQIFDGSYLVGLQSAKVFLEISKNAKEKTDLEVRKMVIDAYINVLLAEENIVILEKNKATLLDNLNETQKIYENGLEEQESVEQLQITFAGVESNLKNVVRLKDLSYKMLNITLGVDINKKMVLTDNLTSLTTENIDLSLMADDFNLEDNVDFKIAKNNERSQELLLKYEKSKALPTLTTFINGGYTGNNESFNFLNSEQKWFGSSIFGVSLNIPIFSSFERTAKTQRAKINFEKAKTELTQAEQQIKLQTANAKSTYQFAIEQYQTAKKNLNLAERIEKKNQTKFFEGVGSSFELRQAQTQLYNSQQEYLQTMLDVINKKAELETILNKFE